MSVQFKLRRHSISQRAAARRTLYPRSNVNLLAALNPTFSGSGSWAFNNSAAYDSAVSATADGSGAGKITNYIGTKAEITTGVINVTAAAQYTVAAKLLMTVAEGMMQLIISPFDSNSRAFPNMTGRRAGVSAANVWQEIAFPFQVPTNQPQIESATAVGAITGSGNLAVTITAVGMTGTPKTINVAVVNGDSISTWAGKVRTALAADSAVTTLFDVGGTSATITLTAKAVTGTYPATDTTLNIAIANGTATGITPVVTSSHTSAGGDASKVRLRFQRDVGDPNGDIWIDEVYLGLARSFTTSVPQFKTAFNGAVAQVDDCGNFSVIVNHVKKPFFPFAIYQDVAATSYQAYADAGFNAVMFGQMSTTFGTRAKAAVNATYAPDGMWFFTELAQYFDARLGQYQLFSSMATALQTLLANACADRLLGGYADVETYSANVGALVVDDLKSVITTWRTYDKDRILHANSGQDASLRPYGATLNTIGSYLSNANDVCLSLDNLEGFLPPLGIGVISITDSTGAITLTAAQFRRDVYKGLIWGCRGFAVYKDAAAGNSIFDAGQSALLTAMTTLRGEINALNTDALPILRQSHCVPWSAVSSNANILVGKREYGGKAYLLLVNNTNGSLTPTITMSGLGYTPTAAKDVLAVNADLTITTGAFAITLGAYGTAALKLN